MEKDYEALAKKAKIDWANVKYDLECFEKGFEQEANEHKEFPDDVIAMIARDHLNEDPEYYKDYGDEAETEDDDEMDEIIRKVIL